MVVTKNHWVFISGRNGVIRTTTRVKLTTGWNSLMKFGTWCAIRIGLEQNLYNWISQMLYQKFIHLSCTVTTYSSIPFILSHTFCESNSHEQNKVESVLDHHKHISQSAGVAAFCGFLQELLNWWGSYGLDISCHHCHHFYQDPS